MKLEVELVPKTAWYSNVRSKVDRNTWDQIRRKCYRKANFICEICGGKGDQWPVECHERWHYDDENKKQTLEGLIALCPNCHKTKHAGRSIALGDREVVLEQLMKVNDMTKSEAIEYIDEVFTVWRERSQHQWELDITYLNQFYEVQD